MTNTPDRHFADEPPDSGKDSDGPPDEHPVAQAEKKGDIHISGAGTFAMAILIVSLSVLFLASMVAYIAIRMQSVHWPPFGMPRLPNSLWISTFVILSASVTIQMALAAVHRDDEKRLVRYLVATFVVGVLFLCLQTLNWVEFYRAIMATADLSGAYLVMFFVLTGLHAAHVVGGLIPLGVVLSRAKAGRYSRNFHPGVRYVTVYWHFLDVIWVMLFSVLYF